jgi:hypothetical protein
MKQTPKKGIALDAAAATAAEAAGATAIPHPPFAQTPPPAPTMPAPTIAMKAKSREAVFQHLLNFRKELPEELRAETANALYNSGNLAMADLISEGKHEDGAWNTSRRFAATNIKVWHIPVMVAVAVVGVLGYNWLADRYGWPEFRVMK